MRQGAIKIAPSILAAKIDEETAPLAVVAGANVLVAGTSVFGDPQGVGVAMKRLHATAVQCRNETKE
jgi:pentose-5-phosphate-3-epimerase